MSQRPAERVAGLLERVLEMTAQERRSFFDALRDEDPDLTRELESLLAAYEQAPDRLDALAARTLPGALDDLARALDTDPRLREQNVEVLSPGVGQRGQHLDEVLVHEASLP